MFLAEQQGEYLADTAKSLENIASTSLTNAIIIGAGVAIMTIILSQIATYIYDKHKEKKINKKLWLGLQNEINYNRLKLVEIIDQIQYNITPSFPFQYDSFLNITNKGILNKLNENMRSKLRHAYQMLENFDHYSDLYINGLYKHPVDLPSDIIELLDEVEPNLPIN